MRKVSLRRLEAGMVLAKPILKGNMIFLNEGAKLTESAMARLEAMEIEHVFVEGAAEQPIPLDEALSLLDRRFGKNEGDPVMVRLKNVVRRHIEDLYE